MVNLKTRKIEPLLAGRLSHVVVGRKTRQVFYIQDGTVYAANLDTPDTRLRKPHSRTIEIKIAGHAFWNTDGTIIWYDLQTPKSKVFWLAGLLLATDETTPSSVPREEWPVHFNVPPHGKLFAGDGGGP